MGVVNTVKCRPPANRTPLRREASTCRPWLDRQVELTDPVVVVTLGGSALAWAMGSGRRLGDVRGQVHQIELSGPGRESRASASRAAHVPPLGGSALRTQRCAASRAGRRPASAGDPAGRSGPMSHLELAEAGPDDAAEVLAVITAAFGARPALEPAEYRADGDGELGGGDAGGPRRVAGASRRARGGRDAVRHQPPGHARPAAGQRRPVAAGSRRRLAMVGVAEDVAETRGWTVSG
jgi:hypothetical protein